MNEKFGNGGFRGELDSEKAHAVVVWLVVSTLDTLHPSPRLHSNYTRKATPTPGLFTRFCQNGHIFSDAKETAVRAHNSSADLTTGGMLCHMGSGCPAPA